MVISINKNNQKKIKYEQICSESMKKKYSIDIKQNRFKLLSFLVWNSVNATK